jgi:Rieske Fe-S protein
MNRRDFIFNSCAACIGATITSGIMSSCTSRLVPGKIVENGVTINKDEFKKSGDGKYHSYVVIRNDNLLFPICVYRFSDNDYSALWMQCAHQGAELNVAGDRLQCPAHGSEYNNKGEVTNGPAETNLRSFPVIIENGEIFIDLRKK